MTLAVNNTLSQSRASAFVATLSCAPFSPGGAMLGPHGHGVDLCGHRGFTNFVDQAIHGGSDNIREAVKIVHVIREELNAVLKENFGGKRVRFIGDCIHGCVAEGERADDPAKTVRQAALCAAPMRSSFDLCLGIVGSKAAIDLISHFLQVPNISNLALITMQLLGCNSRGI